MQSLERRGVTPRVLAVAALALIAGCRLWLAATLPLTDTTEARYGEIARKMVETGDWLVPQHAYGVPYLAKPPLAFWLSAVGIAADGPTELAPRALILVATAAFCAWFYSCMRRWLDAPAALAGVLMLTGSLLGFISAAAVMTDMILTICTTGAVLAFWERWRGGSAVAEVALYVALGLGLLTKGPIAVLFALGPIGAWALATRRVGDVWRRFAWLRGAALALAIAAPWYVAAEIRNPGFLHYFIIGEHIERFLVPGWNGDLYGRAHDEPRGAVWLFLALGLLPWTLGAWPLLKRRGRQALGRAWHAHKDLAGLALAAALVPLALFTFSGNVIFPYALPAMPCAVLAFVAVARPSDRELTGFALPAAGVALVLAAGALAGRSLVAEHTQRAMIAAIEARRPDAPIYYWPERHFSAEYYSRGKATVVDSAAIQRAVAARQTFELVVPARRRAALPPALADGLEEVRTIAGSVLLEPAYAAKPAGGERGS